MYMRVLVTGAKGFVGKKLCARLMSIKAGQARWYGDVNIYEVYEYDRESAPEDLVRYCSDCDFVFNLSRTDNAEQREESMRENFSFLSELLDTLEMSGNSCPVMTSSSMQAAFGGKSGLNSYAVSKHTAEGRLLDHRRRTGAEVLVFPVRTDDPDAEIEMLHIDELVDAMIAVLIRSCAGVVDNMVWRK
jgi:UDP-2-acetamido-2,6-beta-L-arabino-hexul-4-ose reductase